MANKYWIGAAAAVAQVSTGTIGVYDAATTYRITINGVSVSSIGAGSANAVATALRLAANNSTHPYFASITWSGATNAVIGTSDIAGTPFTASLTATGGTGTVVDFTD